MAKKSAHDADVVLLEQVKKSTSKKRVTVTIKKQPAKSSPAQKRMFVPKAGKLKILSAEKGKTKIGKIQGSITVSDKTAKVSKVLLPIERPVQEMQTPSLYRFPMNREKFAAGVARAAGVVFVFLGGILTLLNMQIAFNGSSDILRAQTISAECLSGTSSYNSELCQSGSAQTTSTVIDQTPDVDVVIESDNSTLRGMVPVNIYVAAATMVTPYAYFKEGAKFLELGRPVRITDTQWRFYWNTFDFEDGSYRLKIGVTNEFGEYSHSESSYVIVENYAEISITAETTTTTMVDSTTTDPASATSTAVVNEALVAPTIEFSDADYIDGTETIKVFADGGTVKMYLKKDGDSTYSVLGSGTYYGNREWRFFWNTLSVPDGKYYIKAQATQNDVSKSSVVYTVQVKNVDTTGGDTADTESNETTTTTEAASTDGTVNDVPLQPIVRMYIPKSSPVSGDVDVLLDITPTASFVEVYALRKNTLTPFFLGLASKHNDREWRYRWNTKQSPNGDYTLYSRIGHRYGVSESSRINASVLNPVSVTYTAEQTTTISTFAKVASDIEDATYERTISAGESDDDEENASKIEISEQTRVETETTIEPLYITPVTALLETVEFSEDVKDVVEESLIAFRRTIQSSLDAYAQGYRANDEQKMSEAQQDIEKIRSEMLKSIEPYFEEDMTERIDQHFELVTEDLERLVKRNETIIKDRIGKKVFDDSDSDGVADYDEVNLYHTDPFVADTDGDSFVDGIEIANGYDPKNNVPETLIAYESPQELGAVRDDILTIDTITTIKKEAAESDDAVLPAILTGKGLPNSYVTLYIFSTPIVITLKTDAQGGWSYKFDKELEEGEHEVYVGITDNAGRIVAKSSPLTFVKTAEAYTPVSAAAEAPLTVAVPEPTLFDFRMIFVVGSLAVVGLGLVLILLGLHVHTRKEVPVFT